VSGRDDATDSRAGGVMQSRPCGWPTAALILSLVASVSCGGGGGGTPTPSAPSAVPTRILALTGNLAMGDVVVGSTKTATLTVSNSGTGSLAITGITLPAGFTANWANGSIAAGASQAITIGFTPPSSGAYSGTITVTGDQTSGANTIPVSGSAYLNMVGAWAGTTTVVSTSGGATSTNVCTTNWTMTSQTGQQFAGAYLSSGGTISPCRGSGNVTGTMTFSSGDALTVTLSDTIDTACARVSGDDLYRGAVVSGVLTVAGGDVVNCSGTVRTRAFTVALRRQ
jgi:hypothetical protein